MVRTSGHKSHRSHKRRDRSASDDEEISKGKKQKLEENSVRISRSSGPENQISASKYLVSAGKDIVTSDHSKKRKDVGKGFNGGGDEDTRAEKKAKREITEIEFEKRPKGKSDNSSNRNDMSEKNEETRVDKERSRRGSSRSLYKDSKGKEKDIEKENKYGKLNEKKERNTKHEVEVSVAELPEEMHNAEQIKEIGKRHKRKDEYGDKKKVDDSRDGHSNRSHKDGRYKEKNRDKHDKKYRHYDEKHRRDEHSSRTQSEMSGSREKKVKLHWTDNGGSFNNDDHMSKHGDSKGRKGLSEEIGDQSDKKNHDTKEPCDDTVKYVSSSSKFGLSSDRIETDHSYAEKDQTRSKSSQTEERVQEIRAYEETKGKDTNEWLPAEHGQKSNNAATSINRYTSPSVDGSYRDEIRNENRRVVTAAANSFMPIQHRPLFPSHVGQSISLTNIHMPSYRPVQMWDGNPNMHLEQPLYYGRHEWGQNTRLVMSSNRAWKTSNSSMHLNRNVAHKQAERVKLHKEVDVVVPVKVEACVKKASDDVSYVHYYLSKLDISADLAQPDVYKQCMFFMEGKDVKSTSCGLSMGQRKNNLDSFKTVANSRESLLPHPLDTIFQKAMLLLSKQREGSKLFNKAEDILNEDEKNGEKASDATSEANVQDVCDITKAQETDKNVVCVEVSEKSDIDIANPESVEVNTRQIHLSALSTH